MFGFRKRRAVKRIIANTLKLLLVIYILIFVVGPLVYKYSYSLQRSVIFLNFVNIPPNPDYSDPPKYGIYGVRNFYLTTDDGIKLGVWQILPNRLLNKNITMDENYYRKALKNGQDVIIYNHGNSGNRIVAHRIELYKVLRKNFHVIAYDYRSYGDSSNIEPSEVGVVNDSKFVCKWVRSVTSSNIFVWGHSLGTAISTHTLALLNAENIVPTGLILESPFNNMRDEISEHPFSKMFRHLPWFSYTIIEPMQENNFTFQSDKHITKVDCPILILHAKDDMIVPYYLGEKLYKTAVANRLETQGKVHFHSFDENLNYGHKLICRSPELEDILKQVTFDNFIM
ncbi:hypothetical protein ILUMI_10172 [Ignelater luminosus]|uniref:AB hydrolase-1 domain-containing protein n=1 Tax=Ignelater luminosus TaxID=2038154 RepID=A0A8K0D7N5_IGNLU|nr:hypothetical protein ILUMI_10172 [Ignelater luminosus]